MRLGTCKTGLSPPVIYITDRSKAILLWWFVLFYVLVFKQNVMLAPYVCYTLKVQVGKDQEKEQSEKDSNSKNRCGKKPNKQSGIIP